MLNVRGYLDARSSQDRLAIVEGATGQGVTWREVAELSDRWRSSGLEGPVGLAIADPVAMASNFVAALASGVVVVVPLDPGAPQADLDARIRQLGVRSLVTDRNGHGMYPSPDGIPSTWPSAAQPAMSIETWWADSETLLALGGERMPAADFPETPSRPSLLMSSSGTTGEPKIVPLSEAQLLATAAGVASELALTSSEIGYSPLPLFHINGLVVGVLSALVADSTIVVERQFSRRNFWSTVDSLRATWLNLVPAMLAILSSSPGSSSSDFPGNRAGLMTSRPRLARSASAPLPAGVRERFEEFSSIPVIETYGMTEAASQITANPTSSVRPGSVGLPVDVALRVIAENGETASSLAVGRVQIKGERVTSHYWACQPAADAPGTGSRGDAASRQWTSRTAVRGDGWLDTGDIGYLDEAGYLYLVGRDGDVINRGGEKIIPREVEEVLLAHPDVTAAVVVGRPHPTVGAEPVAFVIASEAAAQSPEALALQLSQRCEEALSRYKRPVEIHVTSSLPAGPTGKIRRGEVASRVAAGVDPSDGSPLDGCSKDNSRDGRSRDFAASRDMHPAGGKRAPGTRRSAVTLAAVALDLPLRTGKPRRTGLTMMIDSGMPLAGFTDSISSAGSHIDLVKFGWGTALVTPFIDAKLNVLRDEGIDAYFGGTLFEKFVAAGRFEDYLSFCGQLGVGHVEISDGTIEISPEERDGYIRRAARDFTVITEVGYKDQVRAGASNASDLALQARQDLQSGAWLVTAEARESGQSGICRPDGTAREDILDAFASAGIDWSQLLFEAPTKRLQVYFVEMAGSNVNLGNVAPGDVIGLETLRLGLRSDTFTSFTKERVNA